MKHEDIMQDKPIMEKIAKKAVKGHEKRMHGAKKMAKGGKTDSQMLQMGRGMAKVANQKTG
tara:strand:+ start:1376 stop:1558 length:183 start_codon:yes stop_codon:yes gene_type:complete